jgi:hypothetical protein
MALQYRELVIEAPPGGVEGLVSETVFDAEREGFDCAPLKERVRELLGGAEVAHLLVPDTRAGEIRAAGARVLHERPLSGARFRFRVRAYSRPHGERLRGWFDPLPAGLVLSEDTIFTETVDPGAEGVESFAPAHDYTLDGSGTVIGSVPDLVAFHRRCRDEELIEAWPPVLET